MHSEDSDQPGHPSLRWAHLPFRWFCHEAAYNVLFLQLYRLIKGLDWKAPHVMDDFNNKIQASTVTHQCINNVAGPHQVGNEPLKAAVRSD